MHLGDVHVHFAPAPLADRIVCAMWRFLDVAEGMPPERGEVHGNPYACLNVVTSGHREMPGGESLPLRLLTGPLTEPVPIDVTGQLRSLCVVFQPWLLRALFGLDPQAMVDRLVDVSSIEHPVLGAFVATVEAAAPVHGRVDGLWATLDALTAAVSAPELAIATLQAEGIEAASRALGVSDRHYRRLFATHMGLTPKAWVRLRRVEAVMEGMLQMHRTPGGLGDVAAQAGYADQSHMTREVRDTLHHTPARLQHGLVHGFAHSWTLQAAHVRFLQDRGEAAD